MDEALDPELLDLFFEEGAISLAELEAGLLGLEADPADRESVDLLFRVAHSLKGRSAMMGFAEIAEFTHGLETLLGGVREKRAAVTTEMVDALLASKDVLGGLITRARSRESAGPDEAGAIARVARRLDALITGEAQGAPAVATAPTPLPTVASPPPPPAIDDPPRRRRTDREVSSSVRVPIEKIDGLVDLVGELVTAHSMLAQTVAELGGNQPDRLRETVARMDRHVRDLHERIVGCRMVPLASVLGHFPRLVRDLATSEGKLAAFEISGEGTELDRAIVERIADPLTHLVRNAVDHGLEPPDVRRRAGKPETGRLRLDAYQQGGRVHISVADDGRGLDRERILARAARSELIPADRTLADADILALIFQPGFSTAERVTEVSGRGVGMDVVKRSVESLGGTVAVESEPGNGTRFVIKLPLTLAMLDGQLLEAGEQLYVLPLVSVGECVRPDPGSVHCVAGAAEVLTVRGETMPLVRLREVFGGTGAADDPTDGPAVVVEDEGRRVAILVDALHGQQQVVIKSLAGSVGSVDGVGGATILGDGRVALILDVPGLVALGRAGRVPASRERPDPHREPPKPVETTA
jgi:two-component system chemotaxis sensor kinase CheA